MPRDFLEELAGAPVPPPPATFDRALHERLNRRLLAGQMIDLGMRGIGYSFLHFAKALAGFVAYTMTGKFERETKR